MTRCPRSQIAPFAGFFDWNPAATSPVTGVLYEKLFALPGLVYTTPDQVRTTLGLACPLTPSRACLFLRDRSQPPRPFVAARRMGVRRSAGPSVTSASPSPPSRLGTKRWRWSRA